MAWIQLIILSPESLTKRIASWLHKNGAVAVTMEESGGQELFEPLPGETPLWQQTRVVGLFEQDADIERISQKLQRMLKPHVLPPFEISTLEDQVWERVWLKDFKPMRFGERTWIIPSVYDPVDPSAVNIRLDPGLAFGTGTHPTTAMCIEWLDRHAVVGADVLDFGCGSGILAIAAAKHGAAHVWAVDIDPQAVQASLDNALANEVSEKISVGLSGELTLPTQFDVVIANILANPLIEFAPILASQVKIGGHIVLSGILSEQKTHIEEAYKQWFSLDPSTEVNGWVMVAGVRRH